jgi:hypothetical protein
MELSMWTLHGWLEGKGFAITEEIQGGEPVIRGFRLGGEEDESGGDYAILTGDARLTLACGYDKIHISQCGIHEAHDALAEAFEHYGRWENSLLCGLLDDDALQRLLEKAHEAFRRPMFIKSSGSWVYAITPGYAADVHPDWARLQDSVANRKADLDSVKAVSLDPDFQAIFTQKYPVIKKSPFYGGDVLHANVWLDGRRVCEIVTIENGRAFNPGDIHLMRHFSRVVERHIRRNKTHFLNYSGMAAMFLRMIEKNGSDPSALETIRQTLGWGAEDELAVFCAQAHAEHETPIVNVLRDKLIEEFPHACVFLNGSAVVGVINATRAGGCEGAVKRLGEAIPKETFVWGMSYEFGDIKSFLPFYRQAAQVLAAAAARKEAFLTMHAVAPGRIAEIMRGSQDLQTCVHPDLRRLMLADAKNNSRHVETLYEYLTCGGNYTDAANRLGLHRNSLIYRMTRIQDLIRSDLNDAEARKALLLSCLIAQQK